MATPGEYLHDPSIVDFHFPKESEANPFLEEKYDQAEKINDFIQQVQNPALPLEQRNEAWRKALIAGCNDRQRLSEAQAVFTRSLERYHRKGETAVIQEATFEIEELSAM